MESTIDDQNMTNDKLRALQFILLALDDVDANNGLPKDEDGTAPESFRDLVGQFTKGKVDQKVVDEVLELTPSQLAQELVGNS